jgi:hypothetical protein
MTKGKAKTRLTGIFYGDALESGEWVRERAARIHGKSGAIQIGLPIDQKRRASRQRASGEILRLCW